MGLMDGWRRKKHKQEAVTPKLVVKPRETDSSLERNIPDLLAEYESLTRRREELQAQRITLTQQLDSGEVTAIQFRKELKERIQEAAEVSDRIKETAATIITLGYRGTLH